VRQTLQTRYDRYMSGRSLSLKVYPDYSRLTAESLDETGEMIDVYAEDYPNKSQSLVRAVLHEAVFLEASSRNNRTNAEALAEGLEGVVSDDYAFAYLSGIGRNAIGLTVINGGETSRTIAGRPTTAVNFIRTVNNLKLIADPDFGLGDFVQFPRPTPRATVDGILPDDCSWIRLEMLSLLAA
jgi:hypothetical protein